MSVRVVGVAVLEDEPDVVGELLGLGVLPVVHLGLDGAQVHGLFDDGVIVVQPQGLGVHGLVKRPGVGLVPFVE